MDGVHDYDADSAVDEDLLRLRAALCSSNFALLYKLHTTKQVFFFTIISFLIIIIVSS